MNLGPMLLAYRDSRRLGVRVMARELGMSHSTLSRIENGKNCDGKTIAKLMLWLFAALTTEKEG